MSYKIKRLEEYIGAALAGVLHVDPHLPVLLAALVVIPVGIFIVNGCIVMLLCYVTYCTAATRTLLPAPGGGALGTAATCGVGGDQGTRVTGHVPTRAVLTGSTSPACCARP